MTFGASEDRPALDVRAVVEVLVATAGLATSLTVLFLGMRAVMDIGGACASGGPYVPVRPCPEGVALLMPAGMLGLFGFGALGLHGGSRLGGGWAGLVLLAWPALFISLGWNFLQYGIAPPADLEPEGGPIWGWLIPGVVFVLMGAIPLWVGWRARGEIRAEGSPAVTRRFGLPGAGGTSVGDSGRSTPRPSMATDPSHAPDPTTLRQDLVDRLERLAALRRAGDLTGEEYELAKTRLLRDEAGSTR
jgi:hypothetical protein